MLNKVMLIGNVGSDPEIRRLDGGKIVANFSLASNETYKDRNGEKQTHTEWHRIECWGKRAEIIEKWVSKGDKLFVEGKLKTDSYEKNGETRYVTKISIFNMIMLSSKPQGSTPQDNQRTSAHTVSDAEIVPDEFNDVDDLPF